MVLNFDSFYKKTQKKLVIQVEDETVAVAEVDENLNTISFTKVMVDGFDDDIKNEAMMWGVQNLSGLPKISFLNDKIANPGIICKKMYHKGIEDGKREILDINRKFYSEIAKKLDNVLDIVQTILDDTTKKLLVAEIKETRDIIQAEIFSSLTDPLTKLFKKDVFEKIAGNRDEDTTIALTTDRMSVSLSKVANGDTLYMVDLNNFKPINDSLGHDVGDHVLAVLGEAMLEHLAPMKCFRVGGDEFIVMSDGSEDPTLVQEFFKNKIPQVMNDKIPQIKESGIVVTGSVGCVKYTPTSLVDLKHQLSRKTEISKMFDKLDQGKTSIRAGNISQLVEIAVNQEILTLVKENKALIEEDKLANVLKMLVCGDEDSAIEVLKLNNIELRGHQSGTRLS